MFLFYLALSPLHLYTYQKETIGSWDSTLSPELYHFLVPQPQKFDRERAVEKESVHNGDGDGDGDFCLQTNLTPNYLLRWNP